MLIFTFLLIITALIIGIIIGTILTIIIKKNELFRIESINLDLQSQLSIKTADLLKVSKEFAIQQRDIENYQERLQEQKQQLIQIKQEFTQEFENLANRIFHEKTAHFSEQNQNNLKLILNPLSQKIKAFEDQVLKAYDIEGKERATLKEQINNLTKLNAVMSEETKNLTNALKGSTKAQGDWGEMILESILEKAGLVEGREYFAQQTHTLENGKRLRPDIIVHLPQQRVVIIDSKVSLTAYERLYSSESKTENNNSIIAKLLDEHIGSLKAHIKLLAEKNYHTLYLDDNNNQQALDFVIMFIPLESALSTAISHEPNLLEFAMLKNIILVSPSTLIAVLRLISMMWRNQRSVENAQQFAVLGGSIFNKLCSFLEIMGSLDASLKKSSKLYKEACNELKQEDGVIELANHLKNLGVITNRLMAKKWTTENLRDAATVT